MICSMSRKGNCWDNAVAESFFHTLKTECTNEKMYIKRDDARADVIEYIEMFYNSYRLHSFLNYQIPNDFENKSKIAKVA
jgi:putative transposase